MGVTNGLALPIPELTESADGPDAFSDLANAVEDYVYDRTLPAGVTRYLPHHWGSGTSLPTVGMGARDGDTYRHTGLGCLMRFNGTDWKQARFAEVANKTARDAMVTNYSALMHDNFEVWQIDQKRMFRYMGGTKWHLAGGPAPSAMVRRTSAMNLPIGQWSFMSWESAPELSDATMWTIGNPTRMFAPIDGIYMVTMVLSLNESHGTAWLYSGISINSSLRRGNAGYHSGVNTPSEWGFTTRAAIAAGGYVEANAFNPTTNVLQTGNSELTPRMELTWIANY
jgi:hypothetical protein